MQEKKRFVERFMEVTGKTALVLGPANRAPVESRGKHRLPDAEEQAVTQYIESNWEVYATTEGEHYVVDKPSTGTISL